MKKWINSVCIDAPTVKQDFSFVALPDSLFVKGTQWRSPLQSKKSKGHSGGFQNHKSLLLNVSAAMVVILHVLHSDSAPDANHKCFDLALIFSPNDAEVAVLAPVLSPGVGSNLRIKSIIQQLHKQFQPMIISFFFFYFKGGIFSGQKHEKQWLCVLGEKSNIPSIFLVSHYSLCLLPTCAQSKANQTALRYFTRILR